jgi:hypothetical protein
VVDGAITNDDVAKYERLVRKVVNTLRTVGTINIGGDWYDELYAAGLEGLVRAFVSFDPTRGVALTSYIYKMAKISMLKCIAEYHAGGRSGTNQCMAVSASRKKLRSSLGREPTNDEVIGEAGKYLRGKLGVLYPSKASTVQAWVSSGRAMESVECLFIERGAGFKSEGGSGTRRKHLPIVLVDDERGWLVEAAHDAGVAVDAAFEFCRHKKHKLKWFEAWMMVRAGGMTLEAAGQEVGYTRERVRQVIELIDVEVRRRVEL